MFPKLTHNSFIKQKPNGDLYVPYKDGIREVLSVNSSASNILKFCDGTHSINDIAVILKKTYIDDLKIIEKNVEDFLAPLASGKIIENKKVDIPSNIVRGSKKIFYPDMVIWEITDYCILNCRHCYLSKKDTSLNSKKDIDNILRIIDDIGIYKVQLTGGEPLSHPEFKFIVNQLTDRDLITSITTNGIILNDEIYESLLKLKKIRGNFIRVSLDGNEQTHNNIRQNKFAYKKAVDFIKSMCSAGISCQTSAVYINQSWEELDELTAFVKEIGVSQIEIGSLISMGNAKKNKINSSITGEKLRKLIKKLDKKYSCDTFVVKVTSNRRNNKNCGAGYILIDIKPNLDVTLCPTTQFKLGNLREESIHEIMKRCGEAFYNFVSPCTKFCNDCEKKIYLQRLHGSRAGLEK